MNQYKYISKPYTLNELVNGNPIFKIYCDFFNDLYEWEQVQEIQQINQLDLDYINTEHLELVLNEFLNILSLLIFDKVSYNETLKKVTLKSKELEQFYLLASIIPNCLEDITLLQDIKITEKTRNYIDKTYDFTLEIGQDIDLLKIAVKHCENLNNTLTEENINDLTNFFDIPQIEAFNEMISKYPFKHKNKEKNQYFKELHSSLYPKSDELTNIEETESDVKVDLLFQLAIFEQIISHKQDWADFSTDQKSEILNKLLGKSKDNIRKYYDQLGKKITDIKSKFYNKESKHSKDRDKAEKLIKTILGKS